MFAGRIRLSCGIAPVIHGNVTLLPLEFGCLEFEGGLIQCLLPLLDGNHTMGDMLKQLRGQFAGADIIEMVGVLARNGIVEPVRDTPSPSANARLAVALVGTGPGRELLEPALADQGIAVLDGAGAPLELQLVSDYSDLARDSTADSERVRLPVKLAGEVAWFGPLFRPGQGACPACLDQRLRLTREAHILAGVHRAERRPGPLAHAAAQVVALQVRRWLDDPSAEQHPLQDALATFDPERLAINLHPVVRRPQCPQCGTPKAMTRVPLTRDCDDRTADDPRGVARDEALFARVGRHLDPLTGLVTALEPVSDHPLNVYRARHVRPLPASTPQMAIDSRRLVAAGKGPSASVARAGALAEALERYSCTWDGSEDLTVASAAELGDTCVLPNDCMLFSQAQLAGGRVDEGYKAGVPAVLDPQAPIGWLKAWSLSRQCWRFVPAGWALMGYRGPGREFSVGDSNGNAAGLTYGDAILSGLCELVERDAVALWWYNRVPRAGVCLDDLPSGYLTDMRKHYRRIGREFWVLDLTSDIGIPTFAAVSQCVDGQPAAPAIAFGSHIDAHTAALRAITEMNQVLPHARAGAPREDRLGAHPGRPDSMELATLDGDPYIRPAVDMPQTRLGDFATPAKAETWDQLEWAEVRVSTAGLELLALNHTRPDVDLPVVRVVVPGMRHFWRRLAPGRLYDVPVRMGWRDSPLAEGEVNPLDLAI